MWSQSFSRLHVYIGRFLLGFFQSSSLVWKFGNWKGWRKVQLLCNSAYVEDSRPQTWQFQFYIRWEFYAILNRVDASSASLFWRKWWIKNSALSFFYWLFLNLLCWWKLASNSTQSFSENIMTHVKYNQLNLLKSNRKHKVKAVRPVRVSQSYSKNLALTGFLWIFYPIIKAWKRSSNSSNPQEWLWSFFLFLLLATLIWSQCKIFYKIWIRYDGFHRPPIGEKLHCNGNKFGSTKWSNKPEKKCHYMSLSM